jgi:uncharacterized protein (TIGR02452 family)
MSNTKYYWGGNRDARRKYAVNHTKEMDEKYPLQIVKSVNETVTYNDNTKFLIGKTVNKMPVSLVPEDSVEAIFNYAEGRTAVLNFASYKNPGGMFIDGSRAQEESLCAESFLYNVLRLQNEYYSWNNYNSKNKGMYINRALYSPDIIFIHNDRELPCDVITCAAPNISPSRKYGWGVTAEDNTKTLDSRIKFVLNIAAHNKVDTLILGAFGCGVFGQDAYEVVSIFKKYLSTTHKVFKKVVFAIPTNVHEENYAKAYEALCGKGK